jgi:heme/copper-type cytochrome/quinol oxidase subunit 2
VSKQPAKRPVEWIFAVVIVGLSLFVLLFVLLFGTPVAP